jgi:hypothetical protein
MLSKMNLDLDPIYPLLNLGLHPSSRGRGSEGGMAGIMSSRRGSIFWAILFWSGSICGRCWFRGEVTGDWQQCEGKER